MSQNTAQVTSLAKLQSIWSAIERDASENPSELSDDIKYVCIKYENSMSVVYLIYVLTIVLFLLIQQLEHGRIQIEDASLSIQSIKEKKAKTGRYRYITLLNVEVSRLLFSRFVDFFQCLFVADVGSCQRTAVEKRRTSGFQSKYRVFLFIKFNITKLNLAIFI